MNEWQRRILRSRSLDELLGTCRDYLASWSPEVLGRVPEPCRPGRIKGVDDVFFWRDRLVDEYCAGAAKNDTDSLIRDLLSCFTAAADHASGLPTEFDPMKTISPLFSDNSIPRLFTSAPAGGGESSGEPRR